ncbi:molybdenum cofactor biosynthesis enzyme [Adlercreutzia sp. ZJ141]|uniref:molybdenum cofactor biosynthesis enzyme n=1 Tax=Adlercreutzia sp. ZJ141 TaxID=2709406 RepID=UPI0013ECF80B|nr:molybdenum cofactor biosynthesis enzyme [Adlercreutzia sp. ZJ141]
MRKRSVSSGLFCDKNGFTTVGAAIALLLTLALVFSSAQVYRINAASAKAQSVADAAALAAMNEVAEFTIVVRLCDAVVLTLSLTGLAAMGLGVVALCTPVTFELSGTLIDAGKKVLDARDTFSADAKRALEKLQRALPLLAAANAQSVAAGNNKDGSSYVSLAVLVPWEGDEVSVGSQGAFDEVEGNVDARADDVRAAAEAAEAAAQRANEAKLLAYEHDCGLSPSRCMYERAATLAGMAGAVNPYYGSVDSWSFSVALNRAKAYYAARLSQEAPGGASVADQARSALRKRLYEYANDQMSGAYVHETEDSFSANFPLLPKNTAEMRGTSLYEQAVYPITSSDAGLIMHAWPGCPNAAGASSVGSIAQMEAGNFGECSECGFTASSMGKVAAASSSIDNGFEYHYRIVAEAAQEYQQAREELDPLSNQVKQGASSLFSDITDAMRQAGQQRISMRPPGSQGVIVLAADVGSVPVGFQSSFVASPESMGARAAVSAATLVEEPASEAGNVIASVLDGLADTEGALVGGAGIVLDCWSALLKAYADGQQALTGAVSEAADSLPLASASGLGTWAARALTEAVEGAGLQPADLDAVKPLLVNSHHVASNGEGTFCATLLSVKQRAATDSGGLFSMLVGGVEQAAVEAVSTNGGKIEVATISILGPNGPQVPIEIALPPPVADAATGLIHRIADGIRGVYAQVVGVKVWE